MTGLETMISESITAAGLNIDEALAFVGEVVALVDRVNGECEAGVPQVTGTTRADMRLDRELAQATFRTANAALTADPHSRVAQAWFQLHQHYAADYVSSVEAEDLLAEIEEWRADGDPR